MPRKCVIPKCESKFRDPNIALFLFPRDENLKKKWLANIPLKNFKPNKFSAVCDKHFPDDMILVEKVKEKDGNGRNILKNKMTLKPSAVPLIFPGISSHTPKIKLRERTVPDTKKKEMLDLQQKKKNELVQKDVIKNFNDFCEKLPEKRHILNSWTVERDLNFVLFYCCDFNNMIPKIMSSVKILKNMTCTVVVNNNILPKSQLSLILPKTLKIQRWSHLEKILSCYKKDNLNTSSETVNDLISSINDKLSRLIDITKSNERYSLVSVPKQLNFLLEQFNLSMSNSHFYSPEMKEWASLILSQSTTAYEAIRNSGVLILPHSRHLVTVNSETSFSPEVTSSMTDI